MASKSLIQGEKECYVCKSDLQLEQHHCLTGCRRQLAEEAGLWVWLCNHHHTGAEGVHNNPRELKRLKKVAQEAWLMAHNGDRQGWLKTFGKNYL